MDQVQKSVINAKEFSSKFNSKREVYRFLATEVGVYLAPLDNMTVWHLKDIACSTKKKIKSSQVKFLDVP